MDWRDDLQRERAVASLDSTDLAAPVAEKREGRLKLKRRFVKVWAGTMPLMVVIICSPGHTQLVERRIRYSFIQPPVLSQKAFKVLRLIRIFGTVFFRGWSVLAVPPLCRICC